MKYTTGINIRKGLELEVAIDEIFMPDLTPQGDVRSKQFFEFHDTNKDVSGMDKEFYSDLKKNEVIHYREFLTKADLSPSLSVFVFSNFTSSYSRFLKTKFDVRSYNDLVFVNNKKISFEDFCFNFMMAQAFTGNFPQTDIQHEFTGVGDFDIETIASVYPLVAAGNCSLEYLFINYRGIMASVQKIINGLIEGDINDQKEYLSKSEYKAIMKELKDHQVAIQEIYRESQF